MVTAFCFWISSHSFVLDAHHLASRAPSDWAAAELVVMCYDECFIDQSISHKGAIAMVSCWPKHDD
jgi:hypothetical protein